MIRSFTPRHRLTLRILVGVGCVLGLLVTAACGTDDARSPAAGPPAARVVHAAAAPASVPVADPRASVSLS